SLVPLITVVLAALQGQERITRARVVGSVLALAGVVLMSGWSLEGAIPIPSILASVGSAVCFAQASLTVRRYPKIDPVVLNAVGMSAGAALLALITVAAGDEISLPSQTETWAAMAYMVIIGSGIVFTLYVVLLRFWEASRANYSFVLIPPLTILVSAWILDEGIDAGLAVGGVLVLLGVYVGALRTRSTLEPQTAED
ncbi:MAG: EamA family transporter, partial [Actinobacteria bacterium]